MNKKFTWDAWDYDCEGDAYVISKTECPDREKVPDYIIQVDNLSAGCKDGMVVQEGMCKYQVRTDWDNGEGGPQGGYYVEQLYNHGEIHKRGWFPVWIVRKGEWY